MDENDNLDEQSQPKKGHSMPESTSWDSVWKWVAISATSACLGLLLGQYTPNRNIVTVDQLAIHIKDESDELSNINRKLDSVTDFISEEKGKEAERLSLSDQQRKDDPR